MVDYREILRLNSLKYAMQVDWADTTIPYYDRVTGEAADSYLFAAVFILAVHIQNQPQTVMNRRFSQSICQQNIENIYLMTDSATSAVTARHTVCFCVSSHSDSRSSLTYFLFLQTFIHTLHRVVSAIKNYFLINIISQVPIIFYILSFQASMEKFS